MGKRKSIGGRGVEVKRKRRRESEVERKEMG
jgi:hypothetical protein